MALSELRRARGRSAKAIQDDQYKLIRARNAGVERVMLFDLAADPLEKNEISGAMPGKTQELTEALETILSAVQQQALRASRSEMDDETREVLRSLGYVD